MPNKKQRARALKIEMENRVFGASLECFTDEQLETYMMLNEMGVDECNEAEWAEFETLEKLRVEKLTSNVQTE